MFISSFFYGKRLDTQLLKSSADGQGQRCKNSSKTQKKHCFRPTDRQTNRPALYQQTAYHIVSPMSQERKKEQKKERKIERKKERKTKEWKAKDRASKKEG